MYNTTDTTALIFFEGGQAFWAGIAYSPATQTMLCAPRNAPSVLMVDPLANSTTEISLTSPMRRADMWMGLAYHPITSRLYCSPVDAASILIINPTNMSTSLLSCHAPEGIAKWTGFAVAGPTGALYAAPHGVGTTDVLVLTPG